MSGDGSVLIGASYGVSPHGDFLFISVDGGTFSRNYAAGNRPWMGVAVNHNGSMIAAVAVSHAIYISRDKGLTWTARDTTRNWFAIDCSEDGSRIYAIADSLPGVIRASTDSGVTWTSISFLSTATASRGIATNVDGSLILVAVYLGNLYVSSNFGASWALSLSSNVGWQFLRISRDGSLMLACESSLRLSRDRGGSWTQSTAISGQFKSAGISANGSYIITTAFTGKVYTSADAGVSFTSRLMNADWWPSAISADGTKMLAGAGGQYWTPSKLQFSSDAGVNWTVVA